MTLQSAKPIRSLLVANRGEIAVRIIRTARRMGIRTIAVYSEADRTALHVAEADSARLIGPPPVAESYLSIAAIIAAAQDADADAIHPGYGFLSENAGLADACDAAGLIFVGPPASAIRNMGSKSGAKALMEQAGVPLVPGYHGEDQTDATLLRAATAIGFPLLIKASAGGGGKGMKIVAGADELAGALASARREASAAFGDNRILIERYLQRPRHIEVQIFADRLGNIVHLFDRDCSVQRRHQKVVEEAPAPGLDAAMRAAMAEAAIAAARAVDYLGAGTVEFIVEDDAFYFMEMNTRLQVEHPVTEAITGLDLVEWQILVAEGEPLPLAQTAISAQGHAIEVRLYAEDPEKEFLPQTGTLAEVALPSTSSGVRIDTGVRSGDRVGVHYDPLLAKLIAEGRDRPDALRKLSSALAETRLVGVTNNRSFLRAVIDHPAFACGAIDTGFIERYRADLLGVPKPNSERLLALAALALAVRLESGIRVSAPGGNSPWLDPAGWRLNAEPTVTFALDVGGAVQIVNVARRGRAFHVGSGETMLDAIVWPGDPGVLDVEIDRTRFRVHSLAHGDRLTLFVGGEELSVRIIDRVATASRGAADAGGLVSPMPGTVTLVSAAPGDQVAKGAQLMIVEAMKMEHAIRAPEDGTVMAIKVASGDLVSEGQELVVMARPE